MREFLKNISIYVIGYILLRAVSFLLLPLYTNVFTTEELGAFSLVFIFIAFAQYVYTYGMDASLMKFYIKNANPKKIYSSIFISLFLTSTIFSFLIFIFSNNIASIVLHNSSFGDFFKIASFILFFDSFSFRVLIIHRMESRPFRYFIFTFSNVLITIIFNYLFLIHFNFGIIGSLYAQLIGSILLFLLSIPILLTRISISSFSFSYLKKIVLFGLPFLPSVIFQMVIDYSDRQMLLYLTNIETVGLYSSSYKIASIILFLIYGFRLGWEPFFLKLTKNKSKIISNISNLFLLFLITIFLFIILFIEPIIIHSSKVFSISIIGEQFWSSLSIIPIIIFGYLFLAIYYLQMPGIYYYNKTSKLPLFRLFGAVSNILLNFILIPTFGLYGAAIATSLSFIIMTIPMFLYTNTFFKINYNWNIICLYLFYVLSIYFLTIFYSINILLSLLLFFIAFFVVFYKSSVILLKLFSI